MADPVVEVPSVGFDPGLTMSEAIVQLGAVVGIAVAGYFVYRILLVAMRWFDRIEQRRWDRAKAEEEAAMQAEFKKWGL